MRNLFGRINPFAFLPAAILAALALAGCENPMDDSPAKEGLEPYQASIALPFRNANLLRLEVRRDSEGTSLKVVNPGLAKVDTATFLLYVWPQHHIDNNRVLPFNPLPQLEYAGRVTDLEAGHARDLGLIDTLNPHITRELYVEAWLFQVSQDGKSQGHPMAGLFAGSHVARGALSGKEEGVARGLIDAEGRFRIGLFSSGNSTMVDVVYGTFRPDGEAILPFYSTDGYIGKLGRISREEGLHRGAFILGETLRDTVDVLLSPRPLP